MFFSILKKNNLRIFLNILRPIYPSTPIEILNVAKTESNNEIIKME